MSARLTDPTAQVGDIGDPEEGDIAEFGGPALLAGDPFILPLLGILGKALVPAILGGVAQRAVSALLPSSTSVEDPIGSVQEEREMDDEEEEGPLEEPEPRSFVEDIVSRISQRLTTMTPGLVKSERGLR